MTARWDDPDSRVRQEDPLKRLMMAIVGGPVLFLLGACAPPTGAYDASNDTRYLAGPDGERPLVRQRAGRKEEHHLPADGHADRGRATGGRHREQPGLLRPSPTPPGGRPRQRPATFRCAKLVAPNSLRQTR